jgi:hypothetical protein
LELSVAKNKKNLENKKPQDLSSLNKPWIPMRVGVIIIAIASVGMAVLTASQVIPSRGWIEGILWGLLFGGFIWAIFFGNILVNKFLRR